MNSDVCITNYHLLIEAHTHDVYVEMCLNNQTIPNKKRNAPLRNVPLSGRSQVIGQFSLYDCKGI